MRHFAIAGVALAILAACEPQTGPLSEDDVAAIRSLSTAYNQVVLSGDWNALVGMFTEDGILMPPNDAVLPISDFLAWIEPMGYSALEHRIEFVDIDGYGDIAYARGTESQRFTVQGVEEPIEGAGKVLSVLRRQPDGSWLFSIWASSSDLPVLGG